MIGAAQGTELKPVEDHGRASFKARLRNHLVAGLVLVVPIWITILLVGFVFGIMRDASLWIIEGLLTSPWTAQLLDRIGLSSQAVQANGIDALPPAVRWGLSGVSALLTVVVLYVLGMVTTNIVGRRIVQMGEAVVNRLPLVKTIYHASKQVLETFARESGQTFQRVVSVPFPSPHVRTVGFITRVTVDPQTGEEACAVFVATAPNPTTGFVLMVKRGDLIDLDWSVEAAVRVIMSGGVLLPDGLGPPASVPRIPGCKP
ncbi:MAG: DUF502 domain-containing protein [Phycisphaerales bacterium]|nr:DUF502 domain-containing protein [Phycisphaerales bacterium]